MCDITKTCARCKEIMEININNISGIALLDNKYYHTDCLIEYASQRIKAKKHASHWDSALEHIDLYEKNAKNTLGFRVYRDRLNDYLLDHYNVITVPKHFWDIIGDLGNGKYQRRKCKPVYIKTILEAWEWSQKQLDDISIRNKMNHKGPKNDSERIIYDLAIVLRHLEDYFTWKAKSEANKKEVVRNATYDEIDMSKLGKVKQEQKEDISDIFDDLYVE